MNTPMDLTSPSMSPTGQHSQIPPWAKWVALFMLFLGVVLEVFALSINTVIFKAINSCSSLLDPTVWSFLTLLGDTSLLWPMLLPLMKKHPKALLCAVASVPVGGCLSWLLKWAFHSPRPAGVLDLSEFTVIGPTLTQHAFPSGHTITAFAACVAVILGVNWGKSIWAKIGPLCLVVAAALIGLSRIMVGAHWPWDVLAGAGVGSLSAMVGWYAIERYPKLLYQVNLQRSIVLIFWVMALTHLMTPLQDIAYVLATSISIVLATWGAIAYLWSSSRDVTPDL